ncbi:MAG: hypothetical protein MUP80_17025 [Acidobacteriia bacterium]|nr:hypothetical protein [Terriglobia bacterium]
MQEPRSPAASPAPTKTNSVEGGPGDAAHQRTKDTERKAFSELALFLLGSGLALLITLLGWSDQIRNFNRDSIDLMDKFVEKTGIRKTDFQRFLRSTNPTDRLAAVTAMMNSGKLKTVEDVELTGLFNQLGDISKHLGGLCSRKYFFTLCLTGCMFATGTVSLFTTANDQVLLGAFHIPIELLVTLLPLSCILVIFGVIIRCNQWEKQFNDQLSAISDRV